MTTFDRRLNEWLGRSPPVPTVADHQVEKGLRMQQKA
jgi:hypothetical protein